MVNKLKEGWVNKIEDIIRKEFEKSDKSWLSLK